MQNLMKQIYVDVDQCKYESLDTKNVEFARFIVSEGRLRGFLYFFPLAFHPPQKKSLTSPTSMY